MPQDFLKYPEPMQDRRRKLDPSLHEEIFSKYETGGYTWRSLAEEYGVSKRLIGLIVNPGMREKMIARNKVVWKANSEKYGREYHRLAIAKLRENKRKLKLGVQPLPRIKYSKICKGCGTQFETLTKTKLFCVRRCFEKFWKKNRKK